MLSITNDVKIEVNTAPRQIIVAKEGSYSFSVPNGEYILTATQQNNGIIAASARENISVVDDGAFTVDLILFPALDEEEKLLEEPIVDVNIDEPNATPMFIGFILLILLILIAFYLKSKKTEKKEKAVVIVPQVEEDDVAKVISIIKKEGGRCTQKDIRKQMPLSEGKISLIITQLESEDKIKKIKKGRGNIIVLI
jgi:uncharacterized membrane protein